MQVISEKDFDEKTAKGVVLVDFFANWCGPCRMMSPILDEAKDALGDQVEIFKVDVDKDAELARKFGVMAIPTLILFVNGKQEEKHVGLWELDELLATINSYVG